MNKEKEIMEYVKQEWDKTFKFFELNVVSLAFILQTIMCRYDLIKREKYKEKTKGEDQCFVK